MGTRHGAGDRAFQLVLWNVKGIADDLNHHAARYRCIIYDRGRISGVVAGRRQDDSIAGTGRNSQSKNRKTQDGFTEHTYLLSHAGDDAQNCQRRNMTGVWAQDNAVIAEDSYGVFVFL